MQKEQQLQRQMQAFDQIQLKQLQQMQLEQQQLKQMQQQASQIPLQVQMRPPQPAVHHNLWREPHRKRNHEDLQCRGLYDRRLLTQLERICEDCYNLFKDPEVHGFCR